MDHDPRAYLWDAKKSADAIAEFVRGQTLPAVQVSFCSMGSS